MTIVSIPVANMLKNSLTLAVSVAINISMKLCFVSVNGPREPYLLDEPRISMRFLLVYYTTPYRLVALSGSDNNEVVCRIVYWYTVIRKGGYCSSELDYGGSAVSPHDFGRADTVPRNWIMGDPHCLMTSEGRILFLGTGLWGIRRVYSSLSGLQ
jgi:hypothetical protein